MTRARLTLPAALLALASPALAQQIYFADLYNPTFDDGSIRTVAADGSGLKTIVQVGGGLHGLDFDDNTQKVYWCDTTNFVIRRADKTGAVEDLVTSGLEFPSAIRLDVPAGRMYWGDQTSAELWSANLDGTDRKMLRSTAFHRGIAIDAAAGKIYWSTTTDRFKGTIVRANLDGTGLETVVKSTDTEFKPAAIALDAKAGMIYWTDYVVDVVRRAPVAGGDVEDLYVVGANRNPGGIALDLERGKVYWGQDTEIDEHVAAIMRMNLDGTGIETVIDGLGTVNDLALGLAQSKECRPDCTKDGALTVNDFICFQSEWRKKTAYGDYDSSGTWTVNDYIAFQADWQKTKSGGGCP